MHTPAPWTVESRPTGGFDIDADFEDQRERVAFAANPANARLIAKAPDLRDALQNLLTAIQHRENNPGFASAGNYVRALERARALLED